MNKHFQFHLQPGWFLSQPRTKYVLNQSLNSFNPICCRFWNQTKKYVCHPGIRWARKRLSVDKVERLVFRFEFCHDRRKSHQSDGCRYVNQSIIWSYPLTTRHIERSLDGYCLTCAFSVNLSFRKSLHCSTATWRKRTMKHLSLNLVWWS